MQTYNYLSNELPRELIELYNDMQSELLRIMTKEIKKKTSPEKVFQKLRDKADEFKSQEEKVLTIIFNDSKKKTVRDNVKEFEREEPEPELHQPTTNNEANSIIFPLLAGGLAILSQLDKNIVNNAMREYTTNYQYVNLPNFVSVEERLRDVYKNFANNGITIYESFGGGKSKNYSIENVLRRDVMYKVNQANADVNMQNFKQSSARFVEVSSHPTARTWNKYMQHPYEDHSSWQGKVYYSREGDYVEGYQEFESACGYGEMLGICGINCYHQFQMNYTGESSATQYSEKEVQRQYELSQQQRAYERAIRKLKQAKSVYDEAEEEALSKSIGQNIRMATSQLKTFCEKNGLKYYNWRTKI